VVYIKWYAIVNFVQIVVKKPMVVHVVHVLIVNKNGVHVALYVLKPKFIAVVVLIVTNKVDHYSNVLAKNMTTHVNVFVVLNHPMALNICSGLGTMSL
jgi:hypothetical protein